VDPDTEDALRGIYAQTKTIAVVGASGNVNKPSHKIPRYLQAQGYRIIPVSPKGGEILGEPVRASLSEIDEPVDVVDVFRPAREAEDVAKEAAAIGAKVLWFQPGTSSPEGAKAGDDAGMMVVAEGCMGVLHGELGLGPGPYADEG
jgi:predicted CoA-binding protein